MVKIGRSNNYSVYSTLCRWCCDGCNRRDGLVTRLRACCLLTNTLRVLMGKNRSPRNSKLQLCAIRAVRLLTRGRKPPTGTALLCREKGMPLLAVSPISPIGRVALGFLSTVRATRLPTHFVPCLLTMWFAAASTPGGANNCAEHWPRNFTAPG